MKCGGWPHTLLGRGLFPSRGGVPVGVLAAVGSGVVAVLVQFLVQQKFKVSTLVVGRNLVPVHAARRQSQEYQ